MALTDFLNGIEIGIIVLSILLFGLSILAFRRTGYLRILFAAIAFILFTMQSFLEYQDDTVDILPDVEIDLVLSGVTLAILLLFFFGIAYKSRKS